MAISRVHTWVALEVLTASDLNNEFNNILNNAVSLVSPLTANLDFNNFKAVNFRFEVQSSTQSAAQQGRAYYQSTEQTLHIDSGSTILRVPTLKTPNAGRGATREVVVQPVNGNTEKACESTFWHWTLRRILQCEILNHHCQSAIHRDLSNICTSSEI